MKSHTDIEQSKKLAEFLPIESADMFHLESDSKDVKLMWEHIGEKVTNPCWSLVALLDVLDYAQCDIHKDIYGWKCYTWPNNWKYESNWNDNPIDACVEMILKLNEQKLL